MKIFNWVHRKLRPSNRYGKVAHAEGKGKMYKTEHAENYDNIELEMKTGETETKALLLGLVNVTDDLHRALDCTILSIGTLGCYQDDFYVLEEAARGGEAEEENGGQVTEDDQKVSEAKHVAPNPMEHHPAESQQQEKNRSEKDNVDVIKKRRCSNPPAVAVVEHKAPAVASNGENVFEPLLKRMVWNVERTTLQDLFLESDGLAKRITASYDRSGKATAADKDGVTRTRNPAKHRKKDDKSPSPPVVSEKVRQLLAKMTRKKIHPEVQKRVASGRQIKHNNGGSDESFLLP